MKVIIVVSCLPIGREPLTSTNVCLPNVSYPNDMAIVTLRWSNASRQNVKVIIVMSCLPMADRGFESKQKS